MRTSNDATPRGSDRDEIIDDLNRLMAEEAEACLRYFQMRFRLAGDEYDSAAAFFADAINETMDHATAIAQQIRALGHVPTLRIHLSLDGGPIGLDAALADALEVEQQALDAYKDFLPRVAGDPALTEFIRKQVEVETEHVQEIHTLVQTRSTLKGVERP